MRCNNCGWDNPSGSTTCQKCNQVLDNNTHLSGNSSFDPRSTMAEIHRPTIDFRSTMADIQTPVVNPRSTMADIQTPVVNPRSTMADIQTPVVNPRSTMADIQTPVVNPRSTMVDNQNPVVNPRATMVDNLCPTHVFHLKCMDDAKINEIEIRTVHFLGLCPGDIIMIKDKRYQVF